MTTMPPSDSDQQSKPFEIMVVDDEELIVDLMRQVLEFKGYSVRTALSAVEALEQLNQQPVDLLFSDIRMPKMDGMELAFRVRQNYPSTRIVMMTGYFSEYTQGSADEIGISEIIRKPFRTSHIVEIVERAIAEMAAA